MPARKKEPEDLTAKKELALEVIDRLKKEYPDAGCTLDYDHAWQLLVSVRLAAQCTDARVNIVVEELFAKYPSVAALAAAEPEDIEAIVKPCGLGHSKARDISACMRMLRDQYNCRVPDTFEESGELPAEAERRVKQSEAILAMIEDGASDVEILRAYPPALNHLPRIQQTRQAILADKYRRIRRTDLKVRYIHGATGVGKTRSILDEYGDENVYRVTNYKHPFDGYKSEPVIVFDEFRSSLPLADMLNYLDVYPLMLPSRYADRVACYTRAFIVSNIPIEKQYPIMQLEEPASYAAFRRRINDGIWEMCPDSGDEPF